MVVRLVSSHFISNLYLKQGQTVSVKSYGIVSTGMMSGPANADGLGNNWQEYAIIKGIPCSAVIAAVKVMEALAVYWSKEVLTQPPTGRPLAFALNAIDFARTIRGTLI